MKKLILIFLFTIACLAFDQQTTPQQLNKKVVEIACGECQFKMKGKNCDLAIRIDGVSYFVDGKTVDDFGDAHAEHGFCNAISKAEVTGEIVDNRFKAKTIKLIPAKKKA
jgi:hypothetical protein